MTDLTALTEITAPTTDDLVYVVDAPSGAKNPRKCSIANLVDARTKTLTNTTIDADGTGNSITNIENADIKSGAAIDYSKLNLTGLVVNADLAGSIANTKLATNPLVYTNMVTPTASVPFGDQFLTGVKDGVNVTDAATKGQLDIAVASDITLKGAYNASTNSPNLDSSPTAGTILKGDHYVVDTAGTFYSEALQVGDSLISEVLNPSSIGDWIITNSQMVTPIVTANIADEAVTEGKIYVSNAGNNGEFLSKQSGNNGGLTWATVPAGYNSPTIGSTSIGSGATVPSLAGLTNVTATGTVQGATVTATALLDVAGNNIDNVQNVIHDLSTATVALDFAGDEFQEITISANSTFTASNYAIGKSKVVVITTDATIRTLAFPAGWIWLNSSEPIDQKASKKGVLSLSCQTGAESGVIAMYAAEDNTALDNVTVSQLANGTDGELITWDTAGSPTTVPVGTATHVLTSNGAGATPTFQAASGGGATETIIATADQAVNNSTTLVNSTYLTKTLSASHFYTGMLILNTNASTVADLDFAFTDIASATLDYFTIWNLSSPTLSATSWGTEAKISGTGSDTYSVYYFQVKVPAGGGTLQIQFAQTTAEASDTKILEGSMITLIDGGAY